MSRDTAVKIGSMAFAFAALVAFFAFLLTFGHRLPEPKPVTDPTPVIEGTDGEAVFACGWKHDPEAVEEFRKTLEIPDFKDTPAGRVAMGDMPSYVYHWKAIEKVTGKPAPVFNQNPVGSCVAFGTGRAYEASLAVQISIGDRFEWSPVVEEVIYGGSRVEVGGGRLRGDGSHGAWAAQWVKRWGALPRGVHKVGGKTYDLTRYNPTLCRQWGASGVPNDLEPEVRKYPAGDATQVTTWAEAKKALAQGYGIAICSNVGFNKPGSPFNSVNPQTRDSRGICYANAAWAHCMCLDGYHVEIDENTGKPTGREYGHIQNSWGPTAHGGPVGWGDPPTSGFWVDSVTINRMLGEWKDSWAFSQVKGFPSRKIDWFAVLPKKQRDDRFTLAIRRFNP